MTESKEIRNFMAFVDASGLPIPRESIVKTEPPKPDVEAVLGSETVAWEMTEAVEPHFRRKLTLLHETPKLVRTAFDALPNGARKALEARHGGKFISLMFADHAERREREAELHSIFEFIASLPKRFGDDSDRTERIDDADLLPSTALSSISMRRITGQKGIFWDASANASCIDTEGVIRDRLYDKMRHKKYKTAFPIELVAYLEHQVDAPGDTGWLDRLAEHAKQLLDESPFRRVWFYNSWTHSTNQLAP